MLNFSDKIQKRASPGVDIGVDMENSNLVDWGHHITGKANITADHVQATLDVGRSVTSKLNYINPYFRFDFDRRHSNLAPGVGAMFFFNDALKWNVSID